MSATSRGLRGTGVDVDTDELIGSSRPGAAVPYSSRSALYDLAATEGRALGTIARLTLGLVMFPHAAQKVFGWFGGYGLEATYDAFTTKLGLPAVLAATVIIVELCSSLMLIAGAFTRLAAAGIMAIMIGAVVTSHVGNGFFMNWNGTQAGEGFEYHLLAIALAIIIVIVGGGALSVDRLIMKWLRPRPRAAIDPVRMAPSTVAPATRD